MNVYKEMYILLFNGISEIIDVMQDTALHCDRVDQQNLYEQHIIALRCLQQQAEERYMESDSEE